MPNSGAGTHHLHVTRLGTALAAGTVPMTHRTFQHVGNDLHVFVAMHREAAVRRYQVIVPDHQSPQGAVSGIAIGRYLEVMTGLEPAIVAAAEIGLESVL
jgi:hypothetical protein